MAELYIRDTLIPRESNGMGQRRTSTQINEILTGIIPRAPKSLKQVRLGFTAEYPKDEDANLFFNLEKINKLYDQNLATRLSYNTQLQREIFIPNVPQAYFDKLDGHLASELEQRNQISLLALNKFKSNKSGKRYIKIVMESKAAKDQLTSKGTVHLYQHELAALAKLSNDTHTSSTNNRGHTYPNSLGQHSTASNNGFNYIPSAQHQGRALSQSSDWAKRPNINSGPTPNNNSPRPGLLATPPGLSAWQNQNSEREIKIFLQATGQGYYARGSQLV